MIRAGTNARDEVLLTVHRRRTDCHFELRLLMDPVRVTGISFWENYEYAPPAASRDRSTATE